MPLREYSNFDGLGLAELVAKREVTPSELVEEAIARIEKHNPALNAVIYKMYEQGRAAAARISSGRAEGSAKSPLLGVPFLLKDFLGNFEGVPTANGCRFMTGVPAARDDTLVVRYKAAGLLPLGKTNAPECGILPTTEPVLYGACHNPWNLDHSTGGSSGGSAAAVAAGIVPLAHANDGGGSIRIPASCCGLVGLKPTRGRNPMGPDIGDAMDGFAVEGVVSRTVRDTAAALDASHGPEVGDPYWAPPVVRPYLEEIEQPPGRLRIGFTTKSPTGEKLHPECVNAIESTAKLCEELGHIVEEVSLPIDPNTMMGSFLAVFTSSAAMLIDAFAMLNGREPKESDFEGVTWGLYQQGRQITGPQFQIAVAMLQIASRQIARFHETYDCWMTTTLGKPPVKLGTIDIHQRDPILGLGQLADYVPFTPIQNATGQPSISLPLHWTADDPSGAHAAGLSGAHAAGLSGAHAAGLPVGVMFTGRFGDEATLFRIAAQLEQARPWKDRRPKVWG